MLITLSVNSSSSSVRVRGQAACAAWAASHSRILWSRLQNTPDLQKDGNAVQTEGRKGAEGCWGHTAPSLTAAVPSSASCVPEMAVEHTTGRKCWWRGRVVLGTTRNPCSKSQPAWDQGNGEDKQGRRQRARRWWPRRAHDTGQSSQCHPGSSTSSQWVGHRGTQV